ncbi:MAG: hypothetical protein CL868_20350 [Cytophagaceae bacterium]|nr:hypothetical protein [Cytophagaceae bacterium]|tara:strand:+ start:1124 stop:1624 length:501 start_codon:yes stop_codon:yes gene_type:complete
MKKFTLVFALLFIATASFAQGTVKDDIDADQTIKISAVGSVDGTSELTREKHITFKKTSKFESADRGQQDQNLEEVSSTYEREVVYSTGGTKYVLKNTNSNYDGSMRMGDANLKAKKNGLAYYFDDGVMSSYAFFNTDGDLVVKTHDVKSDKVMVETYALDSSSNM